MKKITIKKAIAIPKTADGRIIQSMTEKKAVFNRLAKASGHLRKIERMVAEDAALVDILTQLSAVRAEINNAGKVILESHISESLVASAKRGEPVEVDALNTAIERFVK